ncbi:MAG: carbohydrate porin [Candidatus Korobacteraceae bacterium]
MATFTQLHRLKTSKYIFFTFLILSCVLLVALPAVTQQAANETGPGHDQATPTPAPTPAPPSTTFWNQQYLFGDWGGARTRLAEEKGVTFDFFYVGDFLDTPQAAIKTGAGAWNRVRGTMDIDFGKLAGIKGLTFHVTGLWQGGPNIGADYLGSISNPSGLVSARTEMLDSYWLQYAMANDTVELRVGQFASMDNYGLQPYGGSFLMEPIDYGFGNRFNDYASFDPASGPGVQLQVNPAKFMYFKAAYTSGNRNPYYQNPTGFEYVKHDSGVLSDEVGFNIGQPTSGTVAKEKYYPGHYAFGSTYNGGKFANPFTPNVPLYQSPNTGNYLIYFMANQAVYRPKAGSDAGLDAFFGFAISPDATYNFVDKNITGGAVYNGLIPRRPKDSVGFGMSFSHVSNAYSTAYAESFLGAPVLGTEKAFEVNYLYQATPYFLIQPVVQWYATLGGNPQNPTGVVLGFRTKVTF